MITGMITPQEQLVAFHAIRVGRFSASFTPRAAEQLSKALAMMKRPNVASSFELDALQARLAQGGQVSQGDAFALLRFRPQFQNLDVEAQGALEQIDRYVRQRIETSRSRPGSPDGSFGPILVLPPKPTSVD